MKIFNIDNFEELQCKATDYWSLISFFSKIPIEFYKKHNIYTEGHHIYPRGETNIEIPIKIQLPFKYHFLAHYYRAKESTCTLGKKVNYSACQIIIGHSRHLEEVAKSFPNELYDMKQNLLLYPKNVRPIINIETLKIYKSSVEASKYEGIDYHFILKVCSKQEEYYKNSCYKTRYFEYYDETKPIQYYKDLYEKYKIIPKKKKAAWKPEDIKRRADNFRGKTFVHKNTKPIIDIQSGIIYNSVCEALRKTTFSKKSIYRSLSDKLPHYSNHQICNFRYLEDKNCNLPYVEYLSVNNNRQFCLSMKILKFLYEMNSVEGEIRTVFNKFIPSLSWLSRQLSISRNSLGLFKNVYFYYSDNFNPN